MSNSVQSKGILKLVLWGYWGTSELEFYKKIEFKGSYHTQTKKKKREKERKGNEKKAKTVGGDGSVN